MSEAFIGELRIVAFDFAPRGWASCDGQLLPINQNQALFSLLGTTYGGNGTTTFALPDLRSRTPMHVGTSAQGLSGGEEAHTLTVNEMPAHSHRARARSGFATQVGPSNAFWAGSGGSDLYADAQDVAMLPGAVQSVGNGTPHPNLPPYLAVHIAICLQGIFPSRN